MELNTIYKYVDAKYSPIVGYLSVRPLHEIKSIFEAVRNKSGIMYDYFGFEYEDDNTLTFYDFTSDLGKKINIDIRDIINFLEPLTKEYLMQNPVDSPAMENLIDEISKPR